MATSYYENPQQPFMATEVFQPDQLIAGKAETIVTDSVTVHGSAAIQRGTVLGMITASGLYIECVTGGPSDGSQIPVAIAADYIDPTSGDVTGPVYIAGEFNGDALTFDASWSLVTLKTALRPYGIFLKSFVSADNAH
jgi:hypothetical protein